MKIKFPASDKNEIDFGAIDFNKGIIVTNNPYGIIQADVLDDEVVNYYFYTNSNIENGVIEEDDVSDFCSELIRKYPNITAEFLVNK